MTETGARRIVGSKRFRRAYDKLSRLKQRRTAKTIRKLASNPDLPGLHVKPVKGASEDIRSCRVNRGLRLIFRVVEEGRLQLLHVGEHEAAYRKAVMYWTGGSFPESRDGVPQDGGFLVFEPEAWLGPQTYQEISSRLREADFPDGTIETILETLEQTLAEGTDGRAAVPQPAGKGAPFNLIPSETEVPCQDLLLALCFDGDSFGNRLREVAYHAGIHCPDTRAVVLVTSKWNPRKWKRDHERAFADLDAEVIILMAAFGRVTVLT